MDTEFEMRLPVERMSSKSSVDILALDWEAIGRFVRARTLEAVAMHFAAMGGVLSREAGGWHGQAYPPKAEELGREISAKQGGAVLFDLDHCQESILADRLLTVPPLRAG